MKTIDINRIKNIHFVGIKGVAMTALAIWAKEQGFIVTGSDVEEEFPTDAVLKRKKIRWKSKFSKKNISKKIDLVVVTGAHGGKTNIEAKTAVKLGIPVLMQGETLGVFMDKKKGIAVAGSHGKTTTTALISHLLIKKGMDPSFVVGCGNINSLGTPAHSGKGKYFVVEADEYINCPITDKTPKFLFLKPYISVITNIEFDHPDAYDSINQIEKAFINFNHRTEKDGFVVGCIDNPGVKHVLTDIRRHTITYGFSSVADFQLVDLNFQSGVTNYKIRHKGRILEEISLSIPGSHNALNSTAAAIVAAKIGVPWGGIVKFLSTFTGTKRRFELIFSASDVKLYDDYAHHPSEIKATLNAAHSWFPEKRIIAIFQPHTFSRTRALFKEFTHAFDFADIAIISDIYPSAREKPDETISSRQLVERMKLIHPKVYYRPNSNSVVDYLDENIQSGDVVITMGAGDIFNWLPKMVENFGSRFK